MYRCQYYMPQPRRLTGLWNKTDSLSIQSFKKRCFCVDRCDFLPLWLKYYITFFPFVELFWKNSSYVSGVSVCIFVALYVRMFVARANKGNNSNSLTYEPRKGQSPTISRANCVIRHLMLAFHSNNSKLNLWRHL